MNLLHRKYFLIILSVLCVHMLLISIFNYFYTKDIMLDNYMDLNSKTMVQKSETIMRYVDLIETSMEKASKDQGLLEELVLNTYSTRISDTLTIYILTIPGISRISLYTEKGDYYTTNITTQDYDMQVPFDQKRFMMGWSITTPNPDNKTKSLCYVKRIVDPGGHYNYMVVEIDTTFLSDIIHTEHTNSSGMFMLYKGEVVNLLKPGEPVDFDDIISHSKKLRSNIPQISIFQMKEHFTYLYSFEQIPLQFGTVVAKTQMESKLLQVRLPIIITSILMIGISLYVSIFLSNLIWKPLKKVLNRFNTDYETQEPSDLSTGTNPFTK